ncbi:MAG: DEAD/DEAH box helicase, partial [Chloroflexi bacterium]|nr:DEAD/DEAH box helicase [Chloroflexota bacterium]
LQSTLKEYIEATYHISHPALIARRKRIIDEVGVVHQIPYLESTARYEANNSFEKLNLPDAALDILLSATEPTADGKRLIFNPPYNHQARSLQLTLVENKSIIVMTGTGSGKTECFLLPILGKLAIEAKENPQSFYSSSAVRALVLYPMNALVNDQLGRIRSLYSDSRVIDKFKSWAGRPIRFARYTSRTPYPGVRTAKKDQLRLKPIGDYYIRNLLLSQESASPEQQTAQKLVEELIKRGKWPAKADLLDWYGAKGKHWVNNSTGKFQRGILLPNDSELITRHEVHENPPDLLLTNYSMLEYMLMRPIENTIFEATKNWLRENPDQNFLIVLDEAHLYKGAAGAEVGLLIRRLRSRLDIPEERMQVICTSASFDSSDAAEIFGSQLTGKAPNSFDAIKGDLAFRPNEATANQTDAEVLAEIDMDVFYSTNDDKEKFKTIAGFLEFRNFEKTETVESSLHGALLDYPPLAKLINTTMIEAQSISDLSGIIFSDIETKLAAMALTNLIALSSLAKIDNSSASLLPCRIHTFFRGLAGLWACLDTDCSELNSKDKDGPCGAIFSQPRESCNCGSRVFELFSCRNCGSAYARAYSSNIEEPVFLWTESGESFKTKFDYHGEMEPIDILLETPVTSDVEPFDLEISTGRLNPGPTSSKTRRIFLINNRIKGNAVEQNQSKDTRGLFIPCAVCGRTAASGSSSIQDHKTKGDQPFQALITKQI